MLSPKSSFQNVKSTGISQHIRVAVSTLTEQLKSSFLIVISTRIPQHKVAAAYLHKVLPLRSSTTAKYSKIRQIIVSAGVVVAC